MPVVHVTEPDLAELFAIFRDPDKGDAFGPFFPPKFGGFDPAPDTVAELASLLWSVRTAGKRYRLVSLGAAPGEWAVKAERSYKKLFPDGDYKSFNVEADPGHIEMTKAFFLNNRADAERNVLIGAVIAERDGWAYFPVINSEVDWGAGIAALSDCQTDLDSKIQMSERARQDRIAANRGRPLEFRTVRAVSLQSLLDDAGETDFLHSDIQGSEGEVIAAGIKALTERVRICCIATHSPEIEAKLLDVFAKAGWDSDCAYPCLWENNALRRDGTFIWSNPRLNRGRDPGAGLERTDANDSYSSVFAPPYPFDPRFDGYAGAPPERPLGEKTFWHDAEGYLLQNSAEEGPIPLRWKGPASPVARFDDRVSIDSLPDGAWAASYEPAVADPGEGTAGLVYWLYPFNPRVHFWQVNRAGERLGGADLSESEATAYFLRRRTIGAQYLVRLLMLAVAGNDTISVSLLTSEASPELIASSAELAGYLLKRELISRHDPRYDAATRSLLSFAGSAVAYIEARGMRGASLARVVPVLEILEKVIGKSDIPSAFELKLLNAMREHASWSNIGPPRRIGRLPTVAAVGRNSIPELANATPAVSFRFHLTFGRDARLRIEIPDDQIKWASRLIAGLSEVEYLVREYILSDRRRFDIMNEYSIDLGQELTAYGQWDDCPISIPRCVSFERKRGDLSLTLIPDMYFCSSLGYHKLRAVAREPRNWNDRKPMAFWRGTTTGVVDGNAVIHLDNVSRLPRMRLCELGSRSPEIMDFGITNIVQAPSADVAEALRQYCEQRGILRGYVPMEAMADYKLLIDIDGNANSWGTLGKLQLGSCVLKVDSPWEQWFYPEFEPWTHYVPVGADLSDLEERVRWCLDNDEEAQTIAQAGKDRARRMTFDTEMDAASRRLLDCLMISRDGS